jgi:glycosyltransferase involved in cell wall biosynthesis
MKSSRPVLLRILTLTISGVLGILTAQILLKNFNSNDYAIWMVISAIPSLIPFADLGLGTVIFNTFSDYETTDDKNQISIITTVAFIFSSVFTALIILISFGFTFFHGWRLILGQSYKTELEYYFFLLIGLTAICAPLSLANRILYAKKKSTVVILSGLLVPFFTFVLVFYNAKKSNVLEPFVFFGPVIGMLVGNILLTKYAKVKNYLVPISKIDFKNHARSVLRLGFHSSILSSILFFLPQAPRFFLSQKGEFGLITRYSLAMTFINPALSILNPYFMFMAPYIRSKPRNEHLSLIKKAICKSLGISILIYCVLLMVPAITSGTKFILPTTSELAVGGLLVILYAVWGLNYFAQSDYFYQKRTSKNLLLFNFIFIIYLIVIDPKWTYMKLFLLYLIPSYFVIIISYSMSNRYNSLVTSNSISTWASSEKLTVFLNDAVHPEIFEIVKSESVKELKKVLFTGFLFTKKEGLGLSMLRFIRPNLYSRIEKRIISNEENLRVVRAGAIFASFHLIIRLLPEKLKSRRVLSIGLFFEHLHRLSAVRTFKKFSKKYNPGSRIFLSTYPLDTRLNYSNWDFEIRFQGNASMEKFWRDIASNNWPDWSFTWPIDKSHDMPTNFKNRTIIYSSTFASINSPDFPKENFSVVPIGASPDLLLRRQIDSEELFFTQNLPRFLFVGSLTLRKGVPDLLEAFKPFKNSAELLLIANGSTQASLLTSQFIAGDSCKLLQNATRSQVLSAMKQADFIVLPSYYEAFGIALVEAMTLGCVPIVSANTCGPDFMNGTQLQNFIFPAGDYLALRRIVSECLHIDSKILSELSKIAQEIGSANNYQAFAAEIGKLIIEKGETFSAPT